MIGLGGMSFLEDRAAGGGPPRQDPMQEQQNVTGRGIASSADDAALSNGNLQDAIE